MVPSDSVPGARVRDTHTFHEDLLLQVLHEAQRQGVLHRVSQRDPTHCRNRYTRLYHPARPGRRQRRHADQLRLFRSWTSWYVTDHSAISLLNHSSYFISPLSLLALQPNVGLGFPKELSPGFPTPSNCPPIFYC